jgi:hypothetical protein
MRQSPGDNTKLQVPSPLQLSAVQASPSLQVYAVPSQVPAVHWSLLVHALPSLHAVPLVFALQAVWLVAGMHCWHWLVGLPAPPA